MGSTVAGVDQREIDKYWAGIAATPWHKRNLRDVEQVLMPPVSRWGRVVYYAVVPFAAAAVLLSGVLLFLVR